MTSTKLVVCCRSLISSRSEVQAADGLPSSAMVRKRFSFFKGFGCCTGVRERPSLLSAMRALSDGGIRSQDAGEANLGAEVAWIDMYLKWSK